MRATSLLLAIVIASICTAQPIDTPQVKTLTDLRIVKTVARPPAGTSPALFNVIVTNVGLTDSGPFTLTDILTPPAHFDAVQPGPPWLCDFLPPGGQPNYLVCTHPGPLGIGNSVSMQVAVRTSDQGPFENCAAVMCAGDPNEENNEDCACTDFKGCQNLTIDISTGTSSGAPLALGAQDGEWVSANGTLTSPTKVVSVGQWLTPPSPSRWISTVAATSANTTYTYQFDFTLGPEWTGRNCNLTFSYAADNTATFQFDNNTVATLATDTDTNWKSLHGPLSLAVGPGSHQLRAVVTNTTGGEGFNGNPTGLLISGSVVCACGGTNVTP